MNLRFKPLFGRAGNSASVAQALSFRGARVGAPHFGGKPVSRLVFQSVFYVVRGAKPWRVISKTRPSAWMPSSLMRIPLPHSGMDRRGSEAGPRTARVPAHPMVGTIVRLRNLQPSLYPRLCLLERAVCSVEWRTATAYNGTRGGIQR